MRIISQHVSGTYSDLKLTQRSKGMLCNNLANILVQEYLKIARLGSRVVCIIPDVTFKCTRMIVEHNL